MNRDVTVGEVMDREFLAASESDDALETVAVMLREDRDLAVVLRGADPVGVLTDRDALALFVGDDDPSAATVGDAMTEAVPSVAPDETLAAARDRMAARDVSWLVVSDGGEPAGVVTEHDVLTSSALGSEADVGDVADADERFVAAGGSAVATEAESTEADGFDDQGICELCGSLRRDLAAFNGQLLCGDCRDI